MPLNNTAKNLMLDELASVAIYASLHTADPGSSGTNEVSGGSPAYARKSITWNAAATGNLDNNANPVFDVPASTTITHVGFWSAATSGTFYGSADITDEVFAAQGTYTLTDADISLS
ncbi:MAG TPA: hypothetical protein VJ742_12280 [Nitrososphaera sp.]|nr:hypothetical protein [Nitrososphaera sp.]